MTGRPKGSVQSNENIAQRLETHGKNKAALPLAANHAGTGEPCVPKNKSHDKQLATRRN